MKTIPQIKTKNNCIVINCKDDYYAKGFCKRHYEKDLRDKSFAYRLRNKIRTYEYKKTLKMELMNILGGSKCVKCGFSDIRALQFDHINNDGYKEITNIGSNTLLIKWYINNPEMAIIKFQVLCANCNAIKHSEKVTIDRLSSIGGEI